jgi:hypothetical protein
MQPLSRIPAATLRLCACKRSQPPAPTPTPRTVGNPHNLGAKPKTFTRQAGRGPPRPGPLGRVVCWRPRSASRVLPGPRACNFTCNARWQCGLLTRDGRSRHHCQQEATLDAPPPLHSSNRPQPPRRTPADARSSPCAQRPTCWTAPRRPACSRTTRWRVRGSCCPASPGAWAPTPTQGAGRARGVGRNTL